MTPELLGKVAWIGDTVAFIGEVVDAVRAARRLPADLPIIATSGSMGGHGSLTGILKTRHPTTRRRALFRVCDLPYHDTERPDLPRDGGLRRRRS